jgi:Golgi nucleoside diphosphatase
MQKLFFFLMPFLLGVAWGQDLLNEKIQKIPTSKLTKYISRGIFHNGPGGGSSSLKEIRHSFVKARGYERIVFDFSTAEVPRIYGFVAGDQKKMYIDLFNTKIEPTVASLGMTNFVETIKFFPMGEKNISIEIEFKDKVEVDFFYLSSPARFVADIKK